MKSRGLGDVYKRQDLSSGMDDAAGGDFQPHRSGQYRRRFGDDPRAGGVNAAANDCAGKNGWAASEEIAFKASFMALDYLELRYIILIILGKGIEN